MTICKDEYFDLLPGESRKITVYGMAGKLNVEDIRPISIVDKKTGTE